MWTILLSYFNLSIHFILSHFIKLFNTLSTMYFFCTGNHCSIRLRFHASWEGSAVLSISFTQCHTPARAMQSYWQLLSAFPSNMLQTEDQKLSQGLWTGGGGGGLKGSRGKDNGTRETLKWGYSEWRGTADKGVGRGRRRVNQMRNVWTCHEETCCLVW